MQKIKHITLVIIALMVIPNQSNSQIFQRKSIEAFENTECNLWGLTVID